MRYFGIYRLIIAIILFGAYFVLNEREWWEDYDRPLYLRVSLGYIGFAVTMAILAAVRWPRFNRQLTLQALGDAIFILLLLHASGGVRSGLGLLLVVAIAGASLMSQGRLALFYAAIASLGLLFEQSMQLLAGNENYSDYTHAAMLSMSCFATAWLAHTFALRTQQSEELALQRGVDIENLAQINQLVIRDMQDGVIVVDHDARVRHCNTRAETLFGIDAGQLREPPLEVVAPAIAERYSSWANGLATGVSHVTIHGRELLLRFQPISHDRKRGAVIFIEDWSRVRDEARQLKLAALGRLTANIAHEIRNPLSAISQASQLLQEEENADPMFRRLLQIIDDNVLRLDHIVQDVLQLSRRDRSHAEMLPLADFLAEFQEHFCRVERISADGMRLEWLGEEQAVEFDRHHLHQVLWNLCRNGWRHGQKQPGSLRLRAQAGRDDAPAWIEVCDDGPGISAEVRAHLFEPFFTTEAGGTGLGLYVARELCEANGAVLDYVEAPAGARFVVYLKGHYG